MNAIDKILELARILLRNWWRIGLACILVGVLSSVYIFSLPRSYKSEVLMIPEVSSNGMSGVNGMMGAISQFAGVKLGSSEDAIYPEFYPRVMRTPQFLCDLLLRRVKPSELKTEVTLFDYLTKHQKQPWWDSSSGEETKPHKDGPLTADLDPQRLTKRQERLVRDLSGVLTCYVDKRTDMVTINATMQDPDVAAQVATLVQEKMQHYIIDYRTSKSRQEEADWEKKTSESYQAYKDAQLRYANFADAHQDLVLKSAQSEEERLEKELEIAYSAYQLNATQLQMAHAKVLEQTPAFTILQPAGVPTKPDAPKRMVFVGMMLVFTFLLSSVWLVAREVMARAKEENNL